MESYRVETQQRLIDWAQQQQGGEPALAALVSLLREFGIDAVTGNYHCAIEKKDVDEFGDFTCVVFWLKVRGTWKRLMLEVLAPRVFFLMERP